MTSTTTTVIFKTTLPPNLNENSAHKKFHQLQHILHVLVECYQLTITSHTVIKLQVVQNIGRYTTIHVAT